MVVEIAHSGISTGTEKLFWTGTMPPFPGMGYPLVPGYEAAGEVVEAGPDSGFASASMSLCRARIAYGEGVRAVWRGRAASGDTGAPG